MRVAENHRIELGRVKRKRLTIAILVFLPALYQPAIEQHLFATHLEQMARTGDFLGRAA
jgi:hypothetical protein